MRRCRVAAVQNHQQRPDDLALLHIHHEGEHELLYLDEFNAVAQHHLDDEEQRIVPLAA